MQQCFGASVTHLGDAYEVVHDCLPRLARTKVQRRPSAVIRRVRVDRRVQLVQQKVQDWQMPHHRRHVNSVLSGAGGVRHVAVRPVREQPCQDTSSPSEKRARKEISRVGRLLAPTYVSRGASHAQPPEARH